MRKADISVVMTARNDDYGGNLLNRINTSLKSIYLGIPKDGDFVIEIILVEYNPVVNKPLLSEIIERPNCSNVRLRVIQVPNSFHKQFKNFKRIPLFEYKAKNIGIRRASAEYIISTNPDIIFSKELWEFIKHKKIMKNSFYRISRRDLSIKSIPSALTYSELINRCKKHCTYILGNIHRPIGSFREWLKIFLQSPTYENFLRLPLLISRIPYELETKLHTLAAGDFLMMHRSLWNRAGGYDESPLSSHMDGYILGILNYCHSYSQKILPIAIYHIKHDLGKAGRPREKYSEFLNNMNKMRQSGKSHITENKYWGAPDQHFQENLIK